MTMTTEKLQSVAEGRHVFSPGDGLALAAELIAARKKLAAAEMLSKAVEMVRSGHLVFGIWHDLDDALAAWKAAQ